MTIANWVGIGIGALILIAGLLLYIYYRRRLSNVDGFEGFEQESENK